MTDIIPHDIDLDADDAASAVAHWLDNGPAWDWADDCDHEPCDRLSVIMDPRHGQPLPYGLAYKGAEGTSLDWFASEAEARKEMRRIVSRRS